MYAFKYCTKGFISSYYHDGLTNSPGDRTYICNHVENSLAAIVPIILKIFFTGEYIIVNYDDGVR